VACSSTPSATARNVVPSPREAQLRHVWLEAAADASPSRDVAAAVHRGIAWRSKAFLVCSRRPVADDRRRGASRVRAPSAGRRVVDRRVRLVGAAHDGGRAPGALD
jgi:hypothetical protein